MPGVSFIFFVILISLLLVLLMARGLSAFSRTTGLVDVPGSAPHKQHALPTPISGGITFIAALLLSVGIFSTFRDHHIISALAAGFVVFVFGLVDDFKRLNPGIKLAGQILAAVLLIKLGITIQIFESPEFFLRWDGIWDVYLDWILTIIWVVGITNAFNFVDSMDGLAVGLGGITAAFFMLMSLVSLQPVLSIQFALMLGVCAGLYFFNSSPAQFFIGDSGAQTLGFLMAALAILYTPRDANQSSSWFIPILLVGVPIFDAALVIISRLRRGRPVYMGSFDHTYHRLVALSMDSNRAVLTMQYAALLLGGLAIIAVSLPPIWSNVILISVLIAGLLGIVFLDSKKRWQ